MNNSNKIIKYTNNQLTVISHKDENKGCDIRFNLILPYLQQALSELNKDIDFAIFLGDKYDTTNDCKLPYLSFSKHKEYTANHYLIPNIDFFSGVVLNVCNSSLSSDIPFDSKSNSSIFAGANTNGYNRIEYCDRVKNLNNHFSFLKHVQMNKEDVLKRYPDYYKFLSPAISISDQLKHKILVNIDGNGLCWSRLYWQMLSQSIPVYIDKKNYLEQYFDKFDDDECYFSATMNSFPEVYDYILNVNNIDHVQKINKNGQLFIKNNFASYFHNPRLFLVESLKEVIGLIS